MPVLAACSSLALGLAQNHINPLQREQSKAEQASTNGLSIALSAVLGVSVASGMVFYWICSNLLAILVQLTGNAIYKPAKHVDYEALRQSQTDLAVLENLDKKDDCPWWKPNPLAKREKDDIARFCDVVGKHVVFYSERSGFYKYFQGAIEWLLQNSDIRIHYITNDPNDQVFEIHKQQPRLIPYYVGEKRLITMMMKMDCDVFVATLADLDNYHLKRSYVRKDIEYVFMLHHMTSTFLVGSADCHDHYDTLLCVGPHQVTETEREEEVRHLPKKKLVHAGYDLLDRERAEVAQRTRPETGRPTCSSLPLGRRTASSTSARTRRSSRSWSRASASSYVRTPSTPSAARPAGRRCRSASRTCRRTGCTLSRTSRAPTPSSMPTCSSRTGRASPASSPSPPCVRPSLSTRR